MFYHKERDFSNSGNYLLYRPREICHCILAHVYKCRLGEISWNDLYRTTPEVGLLLLFFAAKTTQNGVNKTSECHQNNGGLLREGGRIEI